MKRVISLLLCICLMAGLLAGCSSKPNDAEAYDALGKQLAELAEYTFSGEITMGMAISGSTTVDMTYGMSGTVSQPRQEIQFAMHTLDNSGKQVPFTDIIMTNEAMYMNAADMYAFLFEMMGMSDFISVDDLLGGKEYVVMDYDDNDWDDLGSPFAMADVAFELPEDLVKDHLTVENGVYTLSLSGDEMSSIVQLLLEQSVSDPDDPSSDYMSTLMGMYGVDLTADMVGELFDELEADGFDGCTFSTSLSYDEASSTYTQTVAYSMPNMLSVSVDLTINGGDVEPVAIPENALTEAELASLTDGDSPLLDDEDDEDEDITGIADTSIDWDSHARDNQYAALSLSGFASTPAGLDVYTYEISDDESYGLLVLADGETEEYYGNVTSETEEILLMYSAYYWEPVEGLLIEMMEDMLGNMFADETGSLLMTPLCTSADGTSGVIGATLATTFYGDMTILSVVQGLEDADTALILYIITDEDATSSAEINALCTAIGIDLAKLFDSAIEIR